MNDRDETSKPAPVTKSRRLPGRPATRPGRWAIASSLVALAAFIIANITGAVIEGKDSRTLYDILEFTRAILIGIFFLSGLSALVMSVRGLKAGDRGVFVWAAFVFGFLVSTLMVLEFTIME